jgi:hypothetical protein
MANMKQSGAGRGIFSGASASTRKLLLLVLTLPFLHHWFPGEIKTNQKKIIFYHHRISTKLFFSLVMFFTH